MPAATNRDGHLTKEKGVEANSDHNQTHLTVAAARLLWQRNKQHLFKDVENFARALE